ncbi:MAG: hypothetical protein P8X96_03190 [Desulfobacteraceae bacterium]
MTARTSSNPRLHWIGQRTRETAFTLAVVSIFTIAILLMTGTPPLAAFLALYKGSLGSWIKFSHVVKSWIPLTLCGCGLLFTFRIGLWNIGVEGQVFFLGLSLAAAFAGGGLWAVLAGLLKTKGGVHEIFAGLGMNFVAQAMILWLIFGPWRRSGVASMSGTELLPRDLWLSYIPSLRLSPVSLGLVLAMLVLTLLLLRYTRVGLCLKAIGSNSRAAVGFGLQPNGCLLLALLLAGGLAGLAGSLQVSGVYHRLLPAISSNYGYLALLVVMLANYNIWLVPGVAFFFACLNVGSIQLPMVLKVDSSLSGVIQGALVLSALGMHAFRSRRPVKSGAAPHQESHEPSIHRES